MNKLLVIILFIPFTVIAQSKKKKLRLQQQEALQKEQQLLNALQQHIQFLAADSLEGRRTGTKGEIIARDYLVSFYEKNNITPPPQYNYIQPFEVNEGKKISEATYLSLNHQKLQLNKEYFPLAYSGLATAEGVSSLVLNEKNVPWFRDVKNILEDNKNNPHFDIDDFIKKTATEIAKKGATALILYNSSKLTDNILFSKNDTTALAPIPVIYLTKEAANKYLKDKTADVTIQLQVQIDTHKRTAYNVLAYINNNAPTTVVLGAHYDHLGYGEDKNALDTLHDVHNGADDNASGTAALLELSKILKNSSLKNNNYLIIHFSAEELGLLGSKYWIENNKAFTNINYMINMDMIGRYDTSHKLTIGGYGTSPTWGEILPQLNADLLIKYDSSGSGPSDHASFYRAGYPVLFFFTGSHADYHKTTDDWEKINYTAQKSIVHFIEKIIEATDNKGKLTFTKTTEPQMGRVRFSVSLGVLPDYGYTGTGLKIEGVSAGKLGEKIGLTAGDILIQLGEYKIVDVNSYMQTLSKFKKGDTTVLIIKRNDKELSFNITF